MDELGNLIEFCIALKKLVSLLDLNPAGSNLDKLIPILTCAPDQDKYRSLINEKIDAYTAMNTTANNIVDELKTLVSIVEHDIDTLANQTLNSKEYHSNFTYDHQRVQALQNNQINPIDLKLKSIISAKLNLYSQFHYCGLIVGCQNKEWVDLLVASDPLYLTNYNIKNVINNVISGYPEQYQRRVRPYQVINQDYSKLPQEQFSTVFCWDYFNFINQEEVDRCLEEIFKLLRPGGGFIFNYNNCDLPSGFHQAEIGHMSWNTQRHIQDTCNRLGYNIVTMSDYKIKDLTFKYTSWAEITKPGNLKTAKTSQVIGVIGQK